MVGAITEKNEGIERCLEDVYLCSVQFGDEDDYLNR